MSLFQQLVEKPWVDDKGAATRDHTGKSFAMPRAKISLRLFLTVVMVLFSLFIVMYAERMDYPDWRSVPLPWLLWPNTFVLILSSLALHWSLKNAQRDQMKKAKIGLALGAATALVFLVGQYMAWQDLTAAGYGVSGNPANGFFYLLTGLHGLHLLGGLAALGRTFDKVRSGRGVAALRVSIELCAVYWHFLLMIWLVLLVLLLVT